MSWLLAGRLGRINQHMFLVSATAVTGAFAALTYHKIECSYGANETNVRGGCTALDGAKIGSPCPGCMQEKWHAKDKRNECGLGASSSMHLILASSPLAFENQINTWPKWWQLHWLGTTTDERSKSWLQKIGDGIFVIARGVEIIIRLSPLIILAPTAVIVSSSESLMKRVCASRRNIILSTSGKLMRGDGGDMFVKQFEVPGQRFYCERPTWASNLAWRYTIHTLQSLGPAFCKLGQWAATRRDLFPLHMCNRLSELHDMASTHSLQYTRHKLTEAFGDYNAKGLFVYEKVLGSGSAAQVHKGTLVSASGNPKTVAIKVLHPNTRLLVERDLALMQHIAEFIDTFIPLQMIRMLSLPRAVSNFSDIMKRQVDLRIEGNNLHIFRSNFDCSDTNTTPSVIDFPKPEEGFISEHVLVEDHIEAKPISLFLADGSPEGLEIRKKLAGPLLRAFLKMVFIDNFVHCDLHPGNVLVRESGQKDKYTVVFLDAGIAMSLNPKDKQNLIDLFKAVVLNDGYTAGKLMVERARYEKCSFIPGGKHAFASGIADIVSEFHDRSKQGLTLGAVRVGSLLGRVLDLCRRFRVEIDPAMASVVVSMLVLEGLGRSLDPDLNLMKAAMPFLLGRGKV